MEPVQHRHLEITHACADYQDVLVLQTSLYDKASFVTITKCVDYEGVLIFKCLD